MTSLSDIALLRLAAQRVAGPGLATPGDVVRHLVDVQAQDYPGALISVALRTAGGDLAAVRAALDNGDVVRSWPMRGTLHFVAAADLRWQLALTSEKIIRATARRHRELGIDAPMIDRAREIAVDALRGGRRLGRDALLRLWNEAGLLEPGQRGAHLILHLAQLGVLCWGPTDERGGQQLVLLDEWVPQGRDRARDEALGDWVLRYFAGHGPATISDFTHWTKLTLTEARTGLAVAGDRLERFVVDDVEYFMDASTPALLDGCRAAARGTFLLPGFDEYLLGYRDRGASLPPEFAQRVVPGGNGMFLSTVVHQGTVVGTWRRVGSGTRRGIAGTPFSAFPAGVEAALPRLYERLPA
jgi:hypothetical protein